MFTLIDLPYTLDALAPVISAETMRFHHGRHLKGYVDNLNKLIAGTEYENMSLEEIVCKSDGAIFNNAGQILNHNLYFTQFKPFTPDLSCEDAACHFDQAKRMEKSPLFLQIEKQWGSFEAFQQEFVAKGVSLFGSGWVWLSAAPDGSLLITQETGANNPITRVMPGSSGSVEPGPSVISSEVEKSRLKPLLTFDVWEHAYYLDYQNMRAKHLQELWKIVDWNVVENRLIG